MKIGETQKHKVNKRKIRRIKTHNEEIRQTVRDIKLKLLNLVNVKYTNDYTNPKLDS